VIIFNILVDNRSDELKFDGIVIPMNNNSEYHTLADHEKTDILNRQQYPTIQYCTMPSGEVGMFLPKVTVTLLYLLDYS